MARLRRDYVRSRRIRFHNLEGMFDEVKCQLYISHLRSVHILGVVDEYLDFLDRLDYRHYCARDSHDKREYGCGIIANADGDLMSLEFLNSNLLSERSCLSPDQDLA